VAIDLEALPPEARDVLKKFPEFEPYKFNDSGANGYVLLGRYNVLQREVALKIYFHAPNEMEQEPALIAAINHDNVMKVLDARSLENDCAFFMTPYANYGDLSSYIQGHFISLPLAFRLLRQLLSGLSALHSEPLRLVHRDLKPHNLLVHDDTLLIADFGSVRRMAAGATEVPASKHSVLFRPPEAFGDNGYFDFSSDCYQAGVIGYLLFGGQLSEVLTDHLAAGQHRDLQQLKYENVPFAKECDFVDGCLREKIEKGKLLDWKTIPAFVPPKIVRTLRRATASSRRFGDVSEFLAELAAVGPLPDWIAEGEQVWSLRDWKRHDYRLIKEKGELIAKKRRVGAAKFMTDHALSGGDWSEAFKRVAKKIELP
jgi:serine/threonine protein kinase